MDAEPLPPPVRATELAFAAGTTLILALSWARASPIASLAETLWLLAAVATTAALPAALLWARGQRRGRAWRAAIISAHRLLLFARLQHEEAIANIYLSWAPPSSPLGAVSWLMHLVMGEPLQLKAACRALATLCQRWHTASGARATAVSPERPPRAAVAAAQLSSC